MLGSLCTRYIGVAHGQVPYLLGYLRLAPGKVRIIHNSVDAARYPSVAMLAGRRGDLGLDERDPVVAVSAVLRQEKDHATILRAIQLAGAARAAGQAAADRRRARARAPAALAGELDIQERVVFLGSRADAPELLGCADVVALASHTVECFPYAILEAMAMRRPAVCTAVGGLPEMIEDGVTGYLVPPRDPGRSRTRSAGCCGSEDRGRAMGEAARRRLEERFAFSAMLRAAERELVGTPRESRALELAI